MPSRRNSSSEASPTGKKTALAKTAAITGISPSLVTDLRQLILGAREQVARALDSGLVLLYWSIGHRIRTDVLKEKRAEYGKEIVSAVGRQLASEFGRSFARTNLFNMTRFAENFPDPKIVHALSGQLSWTHFRRIIYLDDPLKRDFYAEMCRIEKWNTRKFFNLTPPSVNSMLIRLEQRGFIRRSPGQARGIQLIIAPDLIPPLERPFKF